VLRARFGFSIGEIGDGDLTFSAEIYDTFAKSDGELEGLEEVETEQTVYTACGREVMAQDIQIGDLLPDGGG